jgi:hopanoid biosynthesis associated RND transporter like protein HpnN
VRDGDAGGIAGSSVPPAIAGSRMLKSAIVRTVDVCIRHPWSVVLVAVALTLGSAVYVAGHFEITTDIDKLISDDLPWRQRAAAYLAKFKNADILAVVDAPVPELAARAADRLTEVLAQRGGPIRAVHEPGGGAFFARNGLLFLPADEVAQSMDALTKAEPLLSSLATDPTLRGIAGTLESGLTGVEVGQLKLNAMTRPLTLAADTLDNVLAGRRASFSWVSLAEGRTPEPHELRRFIEVDPVLDFAALEPGWEATSAIRTAATDLKLGPEYQARVRLTGAVPVADQEFATLREGAILNTTLTVVAVLVILWLALRSARIILAVFVSLVVGLAVTAALGLAMVHALNLISIAFFVLFIGIGVDFGIQFSVRYRSERHDIENLREALLSSAAKAGGPLALAALATAAGFLSFLPTAYRGLAELGQIAGCGMLIAFLASITLLPALLALLNPPGEAHSMGFSALAPVDRFLDRRRVPVIVGTLLVVLAGAPLLLRLPFDFNPMNLRDPTSESVATYNELKADPQTAANSAEVLAPSLGDADAIAARLAKLPEVSRTLTLSTFIPINQEQKLAAIRKAAAVLNPSLNPKAVEPAPSDADVVEALTAAAEHLTQVAGDEKESGPGAAAATRLAGLLKRLAQSDPAARERAAAAFVPTLKIALDQLRSALQAQPIATDTLPRTVVDDWVAADGQARVEVLPKGDPNDSEVLRRFAVAVLATEPSATGAAVSYYESGRTVVRAFIQAGGWALLSIAIILWATLRRLTDVLLTLVPLLMAGMVTLELCVVFDLPLNFANIIALPLLLGVGVAFKIYYIMAWRSGKTALLQSTLTRAVIFSAMTTATAFGSLWLSHHPGTSSMGKLMALSLVCTMAAAVLFQPVLMGPPRQTEPE